MMSDSQHRLEGVLDREIEAARALAATLETERTALTGTSVDAVTATAAEKIELFGRIEKLDGERRELCGAAGLSLPNLRRGMTPLMTGIPDGIAGRWQVLLELMAGCRIANEVNGYIVNARRGQVGQLIQIMRGGPPVTYGPQGKTQSKALRALARA